MDPTLDVPRTTDPERADEARRGRAASWVAATVVVVAAGVAFVTLRDRYDADRYEYLHAHETRAHRMAMEPLIATPNPGASSVLLVVSLDALGMESLEMGHVQPLAEYGYGTIDSLAARASAVEVEDPAPLAELFDELRESLGRRLPAASRSLTVAIVPGRVTDGALDRFGGLVHTDRPHVTDRLDEGDAAWVSHRVLEVLESAAHAPEAAGAALVWARYSDLRPPYVRHQRFRVPRALNTNVAIDHYLGRVTAYLRAAGLASRSTIVVTDDEARLLLVAGEELPPLVTRAALLDSLVARTLAH